MTDHVLTPTGRWREGDVRFQVGTCSCGETFTVSTTACSERAAYRNLQNKHYRHLKAQSPDTGKCLIMSAGIKEPHDLLLCYGSRTHCIIHQVDEPDGEWGCLECGHSFERRPEAVDDPNRLWSCPFCTHS